MDKENTYVEFANVPPQKPRVNRFALFIPKGDYFFTPIILDLNILVFLAMVISGVSPTLPSTNDIMNWGGNNRNAVIQDGQYWRMFTSMFLHYGILHIASNMFAFWQLGRILEPFIGRWRFAILYLLAGLGGSAVSLWWHADVVGAGASGAIFGLFGIFAALLTTDIIDKSVRKKMLRSVSIAIGVNLSIGMLGFIDNSAHLGGLITGMVGGYLSYFDLKSWYYKRIKKNTGLILSVCFTIATIIFFWIITPKTRVDDSKTLLKKFDVEDSTAITFYNSVPDSLKTPEQIKTNLISHYKNCISITKSLLEMELTDEGEHIVEGLQTYSQMRIESNEALLRFKANHLKASADSVLLLNNQADSTIKAVEAYEKTLSKKK